MGTYSGYVVNIKSKCVVYHGSISQCRSVIHHYRSRKYRIMRKEEIPTTYIYTYHINILRNENVNIG